MLKTIDNKIEALKDLYYALEQVEAKWRREEHEARRDTFYMMCDYYNIPVSVITEELGLHIKVIDNDGYHPEEEVDII
jgi:hypothetical protein